MNLGSPEHLNARLSPVRFLQCDADRVSFERMTAVVRGLRRAGDEFRIPDVNEPDAWRKAFEIYQKLQQRENSAPTAAEQQHNANVDQTWASYVINLDQLNRMVKAQQIGGTELEYLGIVAGDLGSAQAPFDPNSRDPNRRRHDWMDVAGRLSAALVEWQSMTLADKALIPQRLVTKRLARAVADLQKRITKLEETINRERQVA
jgi:hypothetical protein